MPTFACFANRIFLMLMKEQFFATSDELRFPSPKDLLASVMENSFHTKLINGFSWFECRIEFNYRIRPKRSGGKGIIDELPEARFSYRDEARDVVTVVV